MGGVCRWGVLVICVAWAVARAAVAMAAPDRLYDIVPDAVPDQKGALAFSWGRSEIGLEGPLASQQSVHNYYKLRYAFNPKSAVTFRYATHELGGPESYGLLTPLFDNQDSGSSLGFDFNVNLMNVPATPADTDKNVAFAAGSSFGLGLAGTMYKLEAGPLSEEETLFNAYLVYSTDLTEELRAHTYFSSGRLTGDTHTGSVNRVGAGLDYMVIPGRRPLTLMANGVLDIYNFRKPTFNTSRVSTFEVGLRYRLAKDWFTTVGWTTVNDSENDVSGSGLFAGVNYVNMPAEKPKECPPPPAEQPAAGETPATPQQQAMAPPPEPAPGPAGEQEPTETATASAEESEEVAADAGSGSEGTDGAAPAAEPAGEGAASESSGTADGQAVSSPGGEPAAQGSGASAEQGSSGEAPSEPASGDAPSAEDNGVAIPAFPDVLPEHTPENAVMLRPEAPEQALPRHTAADSRMLRPENSGVPAGIGPELASLAVGDEPVVPDHDVSAGKNDDAQRQPVVWGAGLISQRGMMVATQRTAAAPGASTGRAYLCASQARLAFLSIVRRA